MASKKNKFLFLSPLITASSSLFSQQKTLDSIKETPKELRTIDPNFKENYLGEEYIYEYSPNFWDNFKNWIISVLESWFNTSEESANSIFKNLETTFYILVISLVIYLIVKMLLNKEGRWIFGKKKSSKGIIYADVETNITEVNFEELIENAIENENYRLAIRYSYLWVLKQLDEKSIIEYNAEKTNVDYQYEVENSAFSENFKTASYYYNYVWYGEFFIDKDAYSKAAELYKNFLNQIKNVK